MLFIIETSENKLLYYKTATSKPWTYTSSVEQKTPSIIKSNKDLKKYTALNNSQKKSHRNQTNSILNINIFRLINLCIPRDACNDLFCVFGIFLKRDIRDAGPIGEKITEVDGPYITGGLIKKAGLKAAR